MNTTTNELLAAALTMLAFDPAVTADEVAEAAAAPLADATAALDAAHHLRGPGAR